MKKLLVVLAVALLALFTGCAPAGPSTGTTGLTGERVEITLWTYPVGGWQKAGTVSQQLASFHRKYPGIRIKAKCIDYTTGDAEVEEAIKNGQAPDLILEGPERLVANWGARGLMVDIADLWEDGKADEINPFVRAASHDNNGKYYIYPMCMTAHCMAINRDLFEKANALQFIDETNRTWTADGFFSAVEAINDYKQKTPDCTLESVAAVYCGGQGGDQGTRALVNNLYSGTFTNAEHTAYTVDSPENIKALKKLKETEGIKFDENMQGADEIADFCAGKLAIAFCWNVSQEVMQTIAESFDFDIMPMTFPTDNEDFNLQGGIWGFGIFDNGNQKRINAAKTFINYLMKDDAVYSSAVYVSSYLPVREMAGLYENDELMEEYGLFSRKYFGDYYQVTSNWANARTAWWQMLQSVGSGGDVEEAVKEFSRKANNTT